MYQKGSYNVAARVCASTREILQRSIQHLCNHKHTYIHTLHCIALHYITLHYISYIPTYIPTYLHHYITTSLHPYIPTYIPTYLHTYIPTYPHTHIPTYIPTHIHTYLPTYIPTYIHTYLPTYIQETPSFPQGGGEKLPHSHRGGRRPGPEWDHDHDRGGGVRGPQFTVFFGFRGSWPNIAPTWPNMGRNLYHIYVHQKKCYKKKGVWLEKIGI